MKCEICHEKIPKGAEKYCKKKILCAWCFERARKKKKPMPYNAYVSWVLNKMGKEK